ncbi:MAG: dockerin type I repeat-containing protein [Planctomycetota bacterium]
MDITAWLAEAGAADLPSGNPFLPGDANLDGVVDGLDFTIWNNNKFSDNAAAWCGGDFTGDGRVDGLDFVVWNNHKFQSSAAPLTAPATDAPVDPVAGSVAAVGIGPGGRPNSPGRKADAHEFGPQFVKRPPIRQNVAPKRGPHVVLDAIYSDFGKWREDS